MTFKEYLKFHHIKITGIAKPLKRKIATEYGVYESVKPIPYVTEADAQILRALSLYIREHVDGISATKKSFTEELNTSFSLRPYKKLIDELDIDGDVMEFVHGCVWAIERLSANRDMSKKIDSAIKRGQKEKKKYQNYLKQIEKRKVQEHEELKRAIKDFSGKEL